jgi:hypothetical protein
LQTDDPRTPLNLISAKSLRIFNAPGLKWKSLETSPGVFNMQPLADFLEDASAAGYTDFLYVIGGIPIDLSPGHADMNTRMGQFVDALVPVLLPYNATIQWMNEPDNGSIFWPGNDVDYFANAIDGLPQRWFDATGRKSVGTAMTSFGATWFQQLLDLGALPSQYIKAYAGNFYVDPSEPEQLLITASPFGRIAQRDGVELWCTEQTQQRWRSSPSGTVYSHPSLGEANPAMMGEEQGAAYVWRFLLAAVRAGLKRFYWFGPDEDFAVDYGCIAFIDESDRSTLLPAGEACNAGLARIIGAVPLEYSLSGTLHSQRFRKNGETYRVLYRQNTMTGDVDLSGYTRGEDMYGDPITLSAAYTVTTPIVVFE